MASKGVNKVILVGNLGQDPEVKYMPNGNAVANISIATSESWKDKNTGQMQEKTEWHRVVIFGKLAEVAGEYLKKGSQVYIEGQLQTRKWQDQQGQDRYSTEIVVQGYAGIMQMLGSKQQGQGVAPPQQQQGGFAPQQQQAPQQQMQQQAPQQQMQQQGGFAPQQQMQQQAPQQQGGYAPQQQQGGFAPQQQMQQQPAVNQQQPNPQNFQQGQQMGKL